MKFNKNSADVGYYYSHNINAGIMTREDMFDRIGKCREQVGLVINKLLALGNPIASNASIDLHFDGFIVKIAGHKGDIAWHEGTRYAFETYGTVVDCDDVTVHESFDQALTALLMS